MLRKTASEQDAVVCRIPWHYSYPVERVFEIEAATAASSTEANGELNRPSARIEATQESMLHKALSAYRWMRTEKGRLHKIGNAASPPCQCGHPYQTGHHITFSCPTWATLRTSLIGDRGDCTQLDDPVWIKTGPEKEDVFDGGEEWFGHIFGFLT